MASCVLHAMAITVGLTSPRQGRFLCREKGEKEDFHKLWCDEDFGHLAHWQHDFHLNEGTRYIFLMIETSPFWKKGSLSLHHR